MKRTQSLHYPFDVKKKLVVPALMDEDGPLGVKNGTELTLNTGAGLSVIDGSLVNALQQLRGHSPIAVTNATVSLDYTSLFQLSNNQLDLKLKHPLIQTPEGLDLHIGKGLTIDNNKLTVNFGKGLIEQIDKKIHAALGPSLQFDNTDAITISTGNGLIHNATTGELDLNIGAGFSFNQKKLQLQLNNTFEFEDNGNLSVSLDSLGGLTSNDQGLSIQSGRGLEKSSAGFLTVKTGPGLIFTNTQAVAVHLKHNGAIYAHTTGLDIRVGWGLRHFNNTIQTWIGAGLTYDSQGKLTIYYGPGFYTQSNQLRLNIGQGLEIQNNIIRNKISNGLAFTADGAIQSNLGNGLEIREGKICVKYNLLTDTLNQIAMPIKPSSPIRLNNGQLDLKFGNGLHVTPDGSLTVNFKPDGLIFSNNGQLDLQLSSHFTRSPDGKLQLQTPYVNPPTLYTRENFIDNVKWDGASGVDTKMHLVLTLHGRLIIGHVRFNTSGSKNGLYIRPPKTLQCTIYFDINGNVVRPQSNLYEDLEWMGPSEVNRALLMPSLQLYPKRTARQSTYLQTDEFIINNGSNRTCKILIRYNWTNQSTSNFFTYAITFMLYDFQTQGDMLNTGSCTFSYIHH